MDANEKTFELSIMALLAAGYINVPDAAEALNLHRSSVYRRCQKLGIDPDMGRRQFVAKWINRASRSGWRPPSKDTLRKRGHNAEKAWREKQAKSGQK